MQIFSNYFPLYKNVRILMKVWKNKKVEELNRFRKSIKSLPNIRSLHLSLNERQTWISDHLPVVDRELVNEIWVESEGTVHSTESVIEGCLIVCKRHRLFAVGRDDTIELTETGKHFIGNDKGKTEVAIDYREGIFELLRLISVNQPCQKEEHVLPAWEYLLKTRSANKKRSTIEDKLRWRLRNLVDRDLILRKPREFYELTDSGLYYLRQFHDCDLLPMLATDMDKTFSKYRSELVSLIDTNKLGDLIKRLLVESAAIEQVRLHLQQRGYECKSVESEDKGWDLEFSTGDGKLLVEVKGISDSTPLASLTPNEYRMSKKFKLEYRIAIVTNVLASPELHIVRFDQSDNTWRDEKHREYSVSPVSRTFASVKLHKK